VRALSRVGLEEKTCILVHANCGPRRHPRPQEVPQTRSRAKSFSTQAAMGTTVSTATEGGLGGSACDERMWSSHRPCCRSARPPRMCWARSCSAAAAAPRLGFTGTVSGRCMQLQWPAEQWPHTHTPTHALLHWRCRVLSHRPHRLWRARRLRSGGDAACSAACASWQLTRAACFQQQYTQSTDINTSASCLDGPTGGTRNWCTPGCRRRQQAGQSIGVSSLLQVTREFLEYSRSRGNDLMTPAPQYSFPGLRPGDRW
jgi:hypothetical protein